MWYTFRISEVYARLCDLFRLLKSPCTKGSDQPGVLEASGQCGAVLQHQCSKQTNLSSASVVL